MIKKIGKVAAMAALFAVGAFAQTAADPGIQTAMTYFIAQVRAVFIGAAVIALIWAVLEMLFGSGGRGWFAICTCIVAVVMGLNATSFVGTIQRTFASTTSPY